MVNIFLGADPGLTGAVVLYSDSMSLISVIDIEGKLTGIQGKVKNEVDSLQLYKDLNESLRAHASEDDKINVTACIERVISRPRQSSQTTFSLGDSFSALRTVIELTLYTVADTYKIDYALPQAWKSALELTSDKESSINFAKEACEHMETYLKRKKDHDRAEAFCLAYYAENMQG